MKYLIIEKWQYNDCKPNYYLREVVDNLDVANVKLEAYNTLADKKTDSHYIIPFDENVLVLSKKAS